MPTGNTHDVFLNLVVLYSRDWEVSARFYGTLGLTFTRHRHGAGPEHYSSEDGPVVFEIYPATEQRPASFLRIGFSVPDIDETLDRMAALQTTVLVSPQASPWGRRAVVLDPDGNRIELMQKDE